MIATVKAYASRIADDRFYVCQSFGEWQVRSMINGVIMHRRPCERDANRAHFRLGILLMRRAKQAAGVASQNRDVIRSHYIPC